MKVSLCYYCRKLYQACPEHYFMQIKLVQECQGFIRNESGVARFAAYSSRGCEQAKKKLRLGSGV